MTNKKYNYSASSLANAIMVCLLISVFCGSLVLISHYQNLFNQKLNLQEEMIGRNASVFNKYINNLNKLEYGKVEEIDLFHDGVVSFVSKKNWGFYDILVCKTIFKKDTLLKIALVGEKDTSLNPVALYVTDYDKPLKVSGKINLYGTIKIPNARTEQAYINSTQGNSIKIYGRQLPSEDKLPKLEREISIDVLQYKQIFLDQVKENVLINGFDKETVVLNLNDVRQLNDIKCKGNIILHSNSELNIGNTSNLTDVLIVAPKVIFESGFKGTVQVISKNEVTLEEDVQLKYPSSIYLKNDIDSTVVKLNKNCILLGGIVIDGDTYQGSLKRKLTIDENVKVIGSIFNYGKTQLKGEVIGSVYTDRFFLETNSADYENVLQNASINRDSLPYNFIELPLFHNQSNHYAYKVIKEF